MISALSYLILYTIIFLYNHNFNRLLSYLGFLTILIIMIFLLTWIPFIEWMMTFAIAVWVMSVSIYLLVKKS
jgi:hypothetical protein